MMAFLLAQGKTIWMPTAASSYAGDVDNIFYFIFWVSLVFFALIVGLMFLFITIYRRRPGHVPSQITHNTALELTWSILPTILLVVMFWWGFRVFLNLRVPPENAAQINVDAVRWKWNFNYPKGISTDELHVPVDSPVRLVMTSADVIHSLYVPAFRTKMDVVPGRYTTAWFKATRPGEYALVCAEYCGTDHSAMVSKVIVHPPGEYEKWLANADPLSKLTDEQMAAYRANPDDFIRANPDIKGLETPAMMGEKLYRRKGCNQCHSVDGAAGTGPTFKGVWGHDQPLRDGSAVKVEENYVRESILIPNAKVAAGFEPVMPTYQGRIKDREIDMIIEYLKTLKDQK